MQKKRTPDTKEKRNERIDEETQWRELDYQSGEDALDAFVKRDEGSSDDAIDATVERSIERDGLDPYSDD